MSADIIVKYSETIGSYEDVFWNHQYFLDPQLLIITLGEGIGINGREVKSVSIPVKALSAGSDYPFGFQEKKDNTRRITEAKSTRRKPR